MRLVFCIRRLLLSPIRERPSAGPPRARPGRHPIVSGADCFGYANARGASMIRGAAPAVPRRPLEP